MKYKKIELFKIRKFSESIDSAFKVFKHGAKPLFASYMVLVYPFMFAGFMVFFNYFRKIFVMSMNSPGFDESQFIIEMLIVYLVYFIAIAIASIFLIVIPTKYVLLYEENNDYTKITSKLLIVESLKSTMRIALGEFVINLIYSFILSIAALIIIAVFSLLTYLAYSSSSTLLLVLVGIVDFFVYLGLLFGIFYFYTPLFLFPTIYLREKGGIFGSLERCFALIKGEWFKTFGMLFLLSLILSTIASFFIMPGYYAFIAKAIEGTDLDIRFIDFAISIAIFSFSSFISFVLYIAFSLKYYSFIEKKEGRSIEEKLNKLEKAVDA